MFRLGVSSWHEPQTVARDRSRSILQSQDRSPTTSPPLSLLLVPIFSSCPPISTFLPTTRDTTELGCRQYTINPETWLAARLVAGLPGPPRSQLPNPRRSQPPVTAPVMSPRAAPPTTRTTITTTTATMSAARRTTISMCNLAAAMTRSTAARAVAVPERPRTTWQTSTATPRTTARMLAARPKTKTMTTRLHRRTAVTVPRSLAAAMLALTGWPFAHAMARSSRPHLSRHTKVCLLPEVGVPVTKLTMLTEPK